jgi:hypothetical protein
MLIYIMMLGQAVCPEASPQRLPPGRAAPSLVQQNDSSAPEDPLIDKQRGATAASVFGEQALKVAGDRSDRILGADE